MRRHLSPDGQQRGGPGGAAPARDNTRTLLVVTVCVIVAAFVFLREPSHPPPSCPPQGRPAGGAGGAAAGCPTMGQLRAAALGAQNGKFVQDTFDAVKQEERIAATGQRGATLWMTGLSGSGKSTIGKELERRLVLDDGMHVYRLDGDNLRFGLSRDLKLSAEDRDEAVRRAGEVSVLMADSGTLTIVSLISPFAKARDAVRRAHQERGIEFLEVFVEASKDEVESRDPKGLYKLAREGKIKGMTGFDAPYEAPTNPELLLTTQTCCGGDGVAETLRACKAEAAAEGKKYTQHCPEAVSRCVDHCVADLRAKLSAKGLIPHRTAPKAIEAATQAAAECPKEKECPRCEAGKTPPLPPGVRAHADGYPDGTVPHSSVHDDEAYWRSDELTAMQPVPLRDVDVQWVQVIGEGWAAPLKGPMREGALVQALHFNSMLINTDGLGGNSLHGAGPAPTDFGNMTQAAELVNHGTRVSMPVPITIPATKKTKALIERALKNGAKQVVLVSPSGEPVAVLSDPELYQFRTEEMITRSWGSWDLNHPYIKENILNSGEYLIGGELTRVRRIRYRDGLDQWRLTPEELLAEFKKKDADSVFAFQTRNPTHAGHAHLMEDGRRQLKERGFKKPVLWLSPLGGWTKDDDVPLDVRVKQHEAVLREKMLDPEETVLAIWPSPMVYSGPTEVQWHAKSRRVAGADFFIVGRDPAGLPYSKEYAEAHNQTKADDVYHADHGRYVLQVSPGMGNLGLLASGAVHYDKTDGKMRPKPDGMTKEEFGKRFLKISGSAMRKMGKMMVDICPSLEGIPSTWSENPSCVPPGFMVKTGWDIMKKYYKTKDEKEVKENAVLQSKMRPELAEHVEAVYPTKVGIVGNQYTVYFKNADGERISPWHDVPLKPEGAEEKVFNMVVEFPKGTNAKFEVQKELPHNPIKQDTKNGLPRYYTYGLAFFNNGLFPQTWEDSTLKDEEGHSGDNDPLDVMEVGSKAHPMGSVVKVKVLGSLGLIDQDETDHKVIALALDDPDAGKINDIASLREVKGEAFVDRIVDWLRNYKVTDKYPKAAKPNSFLNNAAFSSAADAAKLIDETHKRWTLLREGKIETTDSTKAFWLGKEKSA